MQFIDLFNIESFVVKIGVRIKYFTGYSATCSNFVINHCYVLYSLSATYK